ncbi:D-alanyl-D-alanine carboxypeptidase/D-alanyl-D-alanine-endopeptidase [Streptomyces sp. NA04227]|uniref:D-alanyl-D-alanine carboxypeptidase/D-alanyl-D-alanine endopeptidase n=1 Tax=Streptomyces sp. NA04227 TaxID=2742136 RepID=UPI00158FDB95|nr:D-alanyl-D-alanine carboxypeptidase/D-alanyl-D-alanine-endopeptidase [Streptomyces sp. NA04227]QKW07286.1 D-alanyl-D-alanine carboxypeptidase/D-alanyl-D-alanine-endopeptidase [Streptomyces sp. NA04227]
MRLDDLTARRFTVGAAVTGLVLSAGLVAVAGPWDATGQRKAENERAVAQKSTGGADHGAPGAPGEARPAPSAPPVLESLGSRPDVANGPAGRQLSTVLRPLLSQRSLGAQRAVSVVDAGTGRSLYGKGAGTALTPASTTKIATGLAALSAAGPDHRLTTRTVLGPGTRLTLVGGGDPTLTARTEAKGNASLRTLAAATAKELRERGLRTVGLAYDTSLYSGTPWHPIGRNENLAPVGPLMVDQARLDDSTGGTAERGTDPAADAARTFAALLKDHGITAKGKPYAATAPREAKAKPLASVSSPPLSDLVERMLTHSDNDIAEALARQVALARHRPASFSGSAKALHEELASLKLPLRGARFADGSGLDREGRLSAGLLTAMLSRAADPARPELRPVLTGLPVAGFSGTLTNRYGAAAQRAGTGVVRAKTGTLTGVNTLAGTVVDRDGRLLVFAFMTAGSTAPGETQATMDAMASALARCGCR